MSYSELELNRIAKIERMRERGEEPYPHRVERTHRIDEARAAYEAAVAAGADTHNTGVEATICGRLRSLRSMGRTAFCHVEDEGGRLQLMLRSNDLGKEWLKQFEKDYDLGDFVEAKGSLMLTRTGEVTLLVSALRMISKAIRALPSAKEVVDEETGERTVYSAFDNPEARYRERYADLAVNPDVREVFRSRAKVVSSIRRTLDDANFLEVETPVLQPIYGGAAARPFTTHHNQLKQELYLRISFELYLKRLLVGNIERVYEIGRDFRNEGVSYKHNPEFTQVEFYWAYADYFDVMDLTEQMIGNAAKAVFGGTTVGEYEGHEIDFGKFQRIRLADAIQEKTGIDFTQFTTQEALAAEMKAKDIKCDPAMPRGKLIDKLISDFVEPFLIQPTFLYDYPIEISPLAKKSADDPLIVERFEGFVAGMELCNAFTELNDPIDQENRFKLLQDMYGSEDDEGHPIDEDYIRAMSYGMPPNGGFGMGIDRLTMLLTNKHSIREVLLFPHLRDDKQD